MAHLRSGDHRAALAAVAHLRDTTEAGRLAWRITATAHYLEGSPGDALDAWNRLGEPTVDLVRIDGLRNTRYHAARRRLDIADGAMLGSGDLALARRRVDALPSVADSRVSFRPVDNGDVEVTAALLEHPRWPGRLTLAAAAATALFRGEARLEAGPFLGGGDRWTASGAWNTASRSVSVEAAAPVPPMPGVARVSFGWRSEAHASLLDRQERLRGEVALSEWVRPDLRIEGSTGVESWDDGARRVSLGAAARWMDREDRLRVELEGDRWLGDAAGFGRVRAAAHLRLPLDDAREVRARAGWSAVSRSAPPLLRPGAGVGPFRDILLRAHSVERDGSLGGPTLAPRLAHGGVELRAYHRLGPVRVGGLLFADGVAVPARDGAPGPHRFLDVGVGGVVDVSGREAQVTLGYGEAGWRLSARVLEVDAR